MMRSISSRWRSYHKTTVKRVKPMVTSLNADTALLQEDLEFTIPMKSDIHPSKKHSLTNW
ncbi:hypothetical protein QT972_01875 [Microcoleus sp. herbarium7]|uniref:hypothetical protein n=1 Tax=Microcoleus sp. herbarium7 TaxID=3055435 RepID=UPI002FD73227